MAVTWGTPLEHAWAGTAQYTVPTPTGTGGVIVVLYVGNEGGDSTAIAPVTSVHWSSLLTRHYVNTVQAFITDEASPDMRFDKGSGGSSGTFVAVRISDGAVAGASGAGGDGGWWDDAQRTQTLPSLTVAAGSVGFGLIVADTNNVSYTWSSLVEQIDAPGDTSGAAYSFAGLEGLADGTWVPGTVTGSTASYFTYGVVAIPTTGGGGGDPIGGKLKVFDGTEFRGVAKAWNGTEWAQIVKAWNGTDWEVV